MWLPLLLCTVAKQQHRQGQKGMVSSTLRPSLAAMVEMGRIVALCAISKSMLIVIMFTHTAIQVL